MTFNRIAPSHHRQGDIVRFTLPGNPHRKAVRPAARTIPIHASQLEPVPVPIPISGPGNRPVTPPATRIPMPKTDIQHPPETETSISPKDMTALGQAVFRNQTDQVESLLGKLSKTEINQPDANGFPPLAVAVRYGNDFIVKQLLSNQKTDINQRNRDERTPLILAARYGRIPILQQLLKVPQIDLNAKDKNGFTALDWCLKQHNREGIERLKAAGGISAIYEKKKS